MGSGIVALGRLVTGAMLCAVLYGCAQASPGGALGPAPRPEAQSEVQSAAGSAAEKPVVTAEQYRRAEQWLRPNVRKLVKNLAVQPHWIGQGDAFWYLAETADGKRFMRVDAASGQKQPAFDHAAVAAALRAAGEQSIDAEDLPFGAIAFADNEDALEFAIGQVNYRCETAPPSCARVRVEKAPGGILVSPDKKLGVRSEAGNLLRVDLATGEEKALTTDGQAHFGYGIYYGNWKAGAVPRRRAGGDRNFPPMETYWASDSRHLLATRLDQRHVAEYHWLESAPDDGSFRPVLHTARVPLTGEEPAKLEWFVVDTERGTSVRVDLPYGELFQVHQDMLAVRKHWWSADYSRLYLLTWGDLIKSAQLFEVDTATGAARLALSEEMHPRMETNTSTYNPPNVFVLDDGRRAIWFSQRSGWGHLYLYDLQSGALIRQLTEGEWLVRDIIALDEQRGRIFFTASGREPGNPYYRYLYRVDLDGTEPVLLTPEPADHMIDSPYNDILQLAGGGTLGTLSPSGEYIVYNYSTVSEPTRSVIRRVEDAGLVAEFERADASALYAAGWRDPEPFTVKAADGETDLYGVLYKPPELDPEASYPLIDSQYSSPLTAVVPHNFPAALVSPPATLRAASLAELGFVAVVVDARGTTFRSRAFAHHSWQNLNLNGLDDHVAAFRQLAAERPWIDLERVGIHGGSYGGFTTIRAMLEYPEFFDVGVANVAVASFSSMYPDYHWESFHGEAQYDQGADRARTDRRPAPDARPLNYLNNDAELQADRLQGDLLLTVGELDENVLPATTLQFIDELVRRDIDFDMYYFPNRSHGLGSRFGIRKGWDYFVEKLLGAEPPEYRMSTAEE